MKKLRTLLFCTLALCLAFAGALVLTGCKDKSSGEDKSDTAALNAVAGTYTNSWKDNDGSITNTFEIKTDRTWKQTETTVRGVVKSETVITGKFEINAEKQITELTFDDPAALVSEEESISVLGATIPSKGNASLLPQYALDAAVAQMAEVLKDSITFGDGYIMLLGDEAEIMYKDAANKLAEGTVLRTYTEKDYYEFRTRFDSVHTDYESDYYLEKREQEFDLTNAEQKEQALQEFSLKGLVVDKNGNAEIESLELTDVDALGTVGLGTRNATLTYKTGEATTETRTVSYTIMKSEYEFPKNRVNQFNSVYGPSYSYGVIFARKGTEFHDLELTFSYEGYQKYSNNTYNSRSFPLNETNCTGENKLVTVSGYNKDTTGAQTVSITLLGKDYKILVFVYDETVNPVLSAYGTGGRVVITKNGDTYTADYTNAKVRVNRADGTYEEKTLAATDAIDLRPLGSYEDYDSIKFKYETTYDGQTYTFYISITVEVVDETPDA